MKFIINQIFNKRQSEIENFILNFDVDGKLLVKGSRNTIKIFSLNDQLLNIKAFKKPNLLNSFVYSKTII